MKRMMSALAAIAMLTQPLDGWADGEFLRITVGGNSVSLRAIEILSAETSLLLGAQAVDLRLIPDFDFIIAGLMRNAVGAEIIFTLCGAEVARSPLRKPIDNGRLTLDTGRISAGKHVLEVLKSGVCSADL